MFGWIKKFINKTISSYDPVKPKTTVCLLYTSPSPRDS